jgi:CO dehydrogenase maturation factor
VNRAPENLSPAFKKEVESIKIPILCTIPDDKKLLEFDMEKRSLLELPDDSPALSAISDMMTTIKKMIA